MEKKYKELNENPFLSFKLKFNKASKSLEIFQIDINSSLCEVLSHTIEDLSISALEVCVPHFMLLDMNYFEFFNSFLHNTLISNLMGESEHPLSSKVISK